MSTPMQHARPPVIDPNRLVYTLDVLTDGSEWTGHGAIFLTVRKAPTVTTSTNTTSLECLVDDSDPSHPILARYALSGLPTLTARLCADQRLRLASTRAAFLPNVDSASIIGLPSLLLGLSNVGVDKIFVAGPVGVDKYVNSVVDVVLGRDKVYPAATTCEVPRESPEDNDCWWKVYVDEFVLVYAKSIDLERANGKYKDKRSDDSSDSVIDTSSDDEASSDEISSNGKEKFNSKVEFDKEPTSTAVAYIFTLKGTNASFAVLSPGLDPSSPLVPTALQPLPEGVAAVHAMGRNKAESTRQCPLSFLLFLDPYSPAPFRPKDTDTPSNIHADLLVLSQHFLATLPDCNCNAWDSGLLIRASRQSLKLNMHLPFAFPISKPPERSRDATKHLSEEKQSGAADMATVGSIVRLPTCTSLVLRHDTSCGNNDHMMHCVDRRKRISDRLREKSASVPDDTSPSEATEPANERSNVTEHDKDIAKLAALYRGKVESLGTAEAITDDNEISLEDESDSNDNNEEEEICDRGTKALPLECGNVQSAGEHLDPRKPHLIVLGTGCASPSPLRGSSGYALLLPIVEEGSDSQIKCPCLTLAGVIECGEGSLSTLQRHLPASRVCHETNGVHRKSSLDFWLRQVRFIWISHAHLDHYSELPLVIQAIAKAGGRQNECTCVTLIRTTFNRHHREETECKCMFPPLVIAPPKVLRFLEASLSCSSGKSNEASNSASRKRKLPPLVKNDNGSRPTRLYFGVSNKDFDSPFASSIRGMFFGTELPNSASCYRPFALLQSIPVTHCPQAYGLLLGLRVLEDRQFFLCYSGDTRPSSMLVQVCQNAVRGSSAGKDFTRGIDLLIHETTFDDDVDGKKNAISKRHSTVMEALEVARQMDARCCLLTHFSQRYPVLPVSAAKASAANRDHQMSICSALDGMTVPLLDAATIFPLLNTCSTRILLEGRRTQPT